MQQLELIVRRFMTGQKGNACKLGWRQQHLGVHPQSILLVWAL